LVIAILLVYNGLWPNYRTKVDGPESTIGKSGEMKSPGGLPRPGSAVSSLPFTALQGRRNLKFPQRQPLQGVSLAVLGSTKNGFSDATEKEALDI
jgi:hypothetical protein